MDVNVTEKTVSYADIILISPYDIQTITELHVTQRFNEHAKLHLTAIIKEESADSCIDTATSQDNICVQQKLPDGQVRMLFQGLLSQLQIRAIHGIYYIELEALFIHGIWISSVEGVPFRIKICCMQTWLRS